MNTCNDPATPFIDALKSKGFWSLVCQTLGVILQLTLKAPQEVGVNLISASLSVDAAGPYGRSASQVPDLLMNPTGPMLVRNEMRVIDLYSSELGVLRRIVLASSVYTCAVLGDRLCP